MRMRKPPKSFRSRSTSRAVAAHEASAAQSRPAEMAGNRSPFSTYPFFRWAGRDVNKRQAAQGQVGGKEDSQDGGRDPDGWAGLSAAFFLYTCSVHENSPSCPTQPKNPRTGQIISDYIIASYVSECNYRTVTVDRPNFPGFPQF